VESRRRKAQLKREMLPTYQPWVAGVLASGTGAQDAVLMRMLVWLLDVGDITAALDIGDYALRHGLLAPDGFERATPCLIAEEVTASAQRNLNDGQPLDTEQLLRARQMLAGQDMPDKVKARLLKVVGLALRQDGEDEQALDCFRQALAQDETCGVKTEIKQLEKRLASSH
uniref:phage terminase small subunit n=1 Tax=Sodalis sp. (in: enterobacteria) TaxID=1898979 RepID=UPI0038735CC6